MATTRSKKYYGVIMHTEFSEPILCWLSELVTGDYYCQLQLTTLKSVAVSNCKKLHKLNPNIKYEVVTITKVASTVTKKRGEGVDTKKLIR